MVEQLRRRGRPPKDQADVKRHALGVRTTKALKEKLEAAAGATGRSVAQEVEARLEASFRGEKHIAIPLDLAAVMMRLAEDRTGQHWNEDLVTWAAAKKAIDFLFASNRPAAPNQHTIEDAERAYTQELGRWAPAGQFEHLTGKAERLLNSDALDADGFDDALKKRSDAKARLKEAATPAREMILSGQQVGNDIADLFRLRAREE